jgi:hypothetical protein
MGAVLGLICAAGFSANGFAQTAPTDKPSRRNLTLEELIKPLHVPSPPGLPPPKPRPEATTPEILPGGPERAVYARNLQRAFYSTGTNISVTTIEAPYASGPEAHNMAPIPVLHLQGAMNNAVVYQLITQAPHSRSPARTAARRPAPAERLRRDRHARRRSTDRACT